MAYKFAVVLSVAVFIIQVHGKTKTEFQYSHSFSNGTTLAELNHIVNQVINEVDRAMSTVLFQKQTSHVQIGIVEEQLTLPNMRGIADNIFRKLEGFMDAAFEQTRSSVRFAIDKINEYSDKTQNLLKHDVKDVEDGFIKQLDDIKRQAKSLNINIDNCLVGNQDLLIDLPNRIADKSLHCITDLVKKAVSYADDIVNQVETIMQKVLNIKQEIEDCGSGFSAYVCLTKLVVEIGKDIILLPLQIKADVTSTVVSIAHLKDKMEKCASNELSEMRREGREILAIINGCVFPISSKKTE